MASNENRRAPICCHCGSNGQHEESNMNKRPEKTACLNCDRRVTIRNAPQRHEEVYCTFCIHALIPATKTCLLCEASLCDEHLRVHSKSEHHVLVEPTSSITGKKCPEHNKVLQVFCCEDSVCICMDCHHTGKHKGHQTKTLNEAFEKEKSNLKGLLEQLTITIEKTEKRGRSLQEPWKIEKEKVSAEKERAAALLTDIRRQLDNLENRLLMEITHQEEQISHSISDLTERLEIQKDELTEELHHIEALCNAADPLTLLINAKSQANEAAQYMDQAEKVLQTSEKIFPPIRESVHGLVAVTMHKSLTDIITQSTKQKGFFLEEVSDIRLDEKTSAQDLDISADQKMAQWQSRKPLNYRKSMRKKKKKQMHECSQVLSTRIFSSGRHYWEVVTGGGGGGVRLGVTYANPTKKGTKFHVGENEKSWCLRIWYNNYSAIYNRQAVQLERKVGCNKVGVFLDYKAGHLSFYEVDSTVRHLHTFTATFTEPLYAAFWVYNNWVKVIS